MIFLWLGLGLLYCLILLVALWWLGYTGPARPPEPLPAGKILDLHCHVAGAGHGASGCFISKKLRRSWRFRVYLRSFGVTARELERHGDALVIQKTAEKLRASQYVHAAVILAMDGVIGPDGTLDHDETEVYIPNDFIAREIKKYDNLYFGASVNPYRPDAVARLRRAAAGGAVLLKWIPAIMHIDPADEAIIPFYREMLKLKLPLLSHAGSERSFTRTRDELGDPKRLELPLKLGVTVIAAHVAAGGNTEGEDNLARLLPIFATYPNLYADISSLTQLNRLGYLVRALRREEIIGRLLYGSDYPLTETMLCLPVYHPFNLTPRAMLEISRTANSWDRNVRLKQALGVPAQVFRRPAELLHIELN